MGRRVVRKDGDEGRGVKEDGKGREKGRERNRKGPEGAGERRERARGR